MTFKRFIKLNIINFTLNVSCVDIMKSCIVFLITVLLSTNAFVFPDGYEALYEYSAKVMAHMIGEENTSKYEIFADIFFYKNDAIVQMRLENVTYSAYTGSATKNGDRVKPSESITKAIQLPFFFVMENDRYAMKVHKSDEQWSVDMKKSITHMFHVKESALELSSNKVHNEMETVIGNSRECPVEYKVIKIHDEYSVWKEFGSNRCLRPNVELNFTPKMECNVPDDFNNVVKHYSIKNGSNGLVMDSVLSEGTYESVYSKFSVNIQQNIVIKSIDKKTNRSVDLDYVEDSFIPKSSINMENNMNKVKKTLEILVDYVSAMDIKLAVAVRDQEGFASLLDHMKDLDEKHFLQLFEEISQTSKAKSMNELFVQTLPFVSTEGSNRAIRHLIMNKSVDDNIAISMLQNMYGTKIQTKNPYVKELGDLIETDSGLSESVRTAAILAFSTTIGDMEASFSRNGSIREFNERINVLVNKLTEAVNYKDKLTLINAIGNVQYIQILPIVDKIISGHKPFAFNPHLRAVAMLSNLQSLRGTSDLFSVVQIQDKCMYYFKNKNVNLELRLAALQVLMAKGKPRMWIELYWYMLKEENDQIRTLYYSYMKNRAESEFGCYKHHVGFAKQLLKISPNFPAGKSSSFGEIYEFVDSLQNMGFGINLIEYGDLNKDKFHTIYIENVFNYMESIFSVDSIYINFKLKDDYEEKVELNLQTFKNLPQEVLSVEVITYKNNVATFVTILHPQYVIKAFADWCMDIAETNTLLISRYKYFKMETLADHGFLVRTYMSSLTLRESKSNEIELSDIDFRQSNDVEYGLVVKNPLLDVWHGIRRVQKVDTVFDLKFESLFETAYPLDEHNLTWTFVTNNNRTSGFESVGHTEVFVKGKGSQEVLRSSCADCKKNMDTGYQNRNNYTIWEYDDEYTGLFYQLKIFDCDKIGIKQYRSRLREIFMEKLGKLNLKTIYSTFSNFWYYMTLMTPEKTCGIGFSVQPSQKYGAKKIVFTWERSSRNYKLHIDIMRDELRLKTWTISSETKFSSEMNTLAVNGHGIDWKTKKENALDVTFVRFFGNDSAFFKILQKDITPGGSEPFRTIFHVDLEGGNGKGEDGHDFYDECEWGLIYLKYLCKMKMADLKSYKYDVKIEYLDGVWKEIYNMLKDVFVTVD